ncbi:immunoglobulin-like domain-containing protein, partial [Bizionia myxarmorum]
EGNSAAQVIRTVTVQDTTDPTITLNGAATITVEACGTYTELGVTANDPCFGDISGSIVIDASAVNTAVVGTYTVTYNVTDAKGNPAAQITRDVEVEDTSAPTITLLGANPQIIEACGTYTELGATANDPCFGDISGSIVIDASAVNTAVVGTYVVTYNVTDAEGNPAAQVTRNVEVEDTSAPTITLLGANPQIIEACGTYTELNATANDPCFGDISGSIIIDASAVNTAVVGTYTVTYNVVDAEGNPAAQITRDVEVEDTSAPTITLLGANPQIIEACGTYTELNATANDPCFGDISGSIIIDASAVNTAVVGTYTVTYNVVDAEGNPAAQITRDVEVEDTSAPTITLLGANPQTIEACGTYTELGATANDPCFGDISGSIVIDASAVNTAVVGTYTVTYNVMDADGNPAAQVTRNVEVQDTSAPTITLSGANPQTIEACGTYSELGATANDPCFGDISGSIVIDTSAVNTAVVGTYVVTYNVTDAEGNPAAQITRNVEVEDTSAPTMTLLGANPQTIETCDTYLELGATAIDPCFGDISGSIVIDASAVNTAVVGTYVVTYNVTDAEGNPAAQITRDVEVEDISAPTAACQNITIQLGATGNATIVAADIDNGSSDTCSTVTLTASQTTFDCTNLGDNSVTLTVEDINGNIATCNATVTVEDIINPAATCQNITIQLDATGNASIVAADIDDGSSDGCGGAVTLTASQTTFNCTHIGSNSVTLTVEDASGNITTCNAIVTVQDTIIPTATVTPATITYECLSNVPAPDISVVNPTDNCNTTISHISDVSSGNNPATIIRTYRITDLGGNFIDVTQTITVTYNVTPFIPNDYSIATCSSNIANVSPINGVGGNIIPTGTTYSWGMPTISGSITGATALSGQPNFSQTLINTSSIPQTATYTVTAGIGSCSPSTFEIVVTVNPTPTLTATPGTNQTICSGDNITPIVLSPNPNNVAGTTFSWTRSVNTNVIGIPNGSGSSITGVLTNTSITPQIVDITITAYANGCPSLPNTISITVNPTPIVSATTATQEICSGANAIITLATNVAGTTTYNWTRDNTGVVTGTNFENNISGPISIALTNTTTTTQTTTFAITATTNGCPSPVVYVTVSVIAPLRTPFTIGDAQDVCNGQDPADLHIITAPTGGSGNYNYQWQVSTNGNAGTYANVAANGNGPVYSPPQQERYYRLIITDQACPSSTLISAGIQINYIGAGGILGGMSITNAPNPAIGYCPGDTITPTYTIEHTIASTIDFIYSANSAYVSPSNGQIDAPYTNIGGFFNRRRRSQVNQTFTLQNPGNTTVTTQIFITPEYNVRICFFGCLEYACNGEPEIMNVTIHPTPKANATIANPTICSGSNAQITIAGNIIDAPMNFNWVRNTPAGISGTPVNGNSGNIAAGNTFTIPGTLTNSTNAPIEVTYTITPLATTSPTCPGSAITRTVTILPEITGGTINTDQVICSGDIPTIFNGSVGIAGTTYQWEVSTDNVNFTPIGGATAQNYTPANSITTITYYRRITTFTLNSVSCSGISNVITITPNLVTAGTIANNQTICSGIIPNNLTGTVATATAASSTIDYLWETSPNPGGPWTSTGITTVGYNFIGGVASTTYFRRVATIENGSSSCTVYSNIVTIFVNNVNITSFGADQTVCSTNTPNVISVIANGSGTLSYQWQSSINASGPWANVGGNQASYQPPLLTQTNYYQVIVTSNNVVSCTATSGIITITVNPFITANAGSDINYSVTNCGATSATLHALNPNGEWSVTNGAGGSFSDVTNPNAIFTGQMDETYVLQWQVTNALPCGISNDTMSVTFAGCANFIDFDGTNDHIDLGDNYNLSGDFSIELWLKRDNTVNNAQTLLSKRDLNDLSTGYDLRINNGVVEFRYDNETIPTSVTINDLRWHHVAITFDSTLGTYILYIDGINVGSNTGASAPDTNNYNCLIGALGNNSNTPMNYFNGALDELRIWNATLTEVQIHEMMNQEIETNSGQVHGSIVPLNITDLAWISLRGYYQMNQGTGDVTGGYLYANVGTVNGRLRNMTTNQAETAPLPYISGGDGNWNSNSTWLYGSVQVTPNTNGMDWNIVRILHNVTSGNRATTLLGLLIDSNTYTVNNNQLLRVTNYLKIDDVLDLVGESQLLQNMGSIVDYTGNGYMERDQQGTSNHFNYNYWGSPVSTDDALGTRTYTLSGIISNAAWTPGNDGSLTPLTISSRWIYAFSEGAQDDYSDWDYRGNNGSFDVGLGFTMKGPGPVTPVGTQNYTFRGQPNNGTISAKVSASSSVINQTLVGNPYASAIDANVFIRDNIPATIGGVATSANVGSSESIDGSLYFWKQSTTNNSHITADYQGGYAIYNLSGGTPAVSPPGINGVGNANLVTPKQFIPVGQGFFVTAAANADQVTNDVTFKNSQRAFVKEAMGNSEFFRTENPDVTLDLIQRVRLNFTSPEGAIRPLLLAFTPDNAASELFEYGYDALNTDYNPSDMSFIIEDDRFIIQGVGEFNQENMYPITIDMGITGNAEIAVTDLENFDEDPDVFVYDALLGTYTRINITPYQTNLDAGTHEGRFYIVFQEENVLSTDTDDYPDVIVNYLNSTNHIYIKVPYSMDIKQVYLINMLGQTVRSWNSTNAPIGHECKIPVRLISEGNYIIKVQTSDGQTINKKIVVKQQ